MYLGIASIIGLFLVIILKIVRKIIKKIIYKKIPNFSGDYHFVEDTLIDTNIIHKHKSRKVISINKIYETTSHKIKRYMITKNRNDLSLIYEYGEKVYHVNLLIYFYNKKKKLIYIYRVEEGVKSNYSKQLIIPKKTSYVNFVDYNDELENYYKKQLIRDRNLLIYDCVSFFLMMFFISYWTVFILAGNLLGSYLNGYGLLINLLLILIITILNFAMNMTIIQKRNPVL
jgi:hypothetical protein